MKRVFIKETIKHLGEKIKVSGWVNSRRDHGGIVFLDLRDKTGILQVVCKPDAIKEVKDEYVLEIEGEVKKRPDSMINSDIATGEIELKSEAVKILASSKPLPFDLRELKVKLPTLLDYRPLTLRSGKVKAIFKIKEKVISSFREILSKEGFTEFQAPSIVPVATEGGAEVFHIDYFDYDAYLAQSPQLYKQIMVGVFERVFAVAHAYRAEPSVTTRHLTEYISLDVEMGFIEKWEELLEICEKVLYYIISKIKEDCQNELKLLKAETLENPIHIPRLKMREAQEIIFQRTGRDNREEPDLEPDDEREICLWAKEKHNSDFIFITHYPTAKRPFYTYPDPQNPDYTLSFDLLYRGLEIITGGQRINDYKQLLSNIKKWKLNEKNFKFYLQAFQYGMPPEGGFALGSERIVKQILGLESVKEAAAFPRDMSRIDHRLAVIQKAKEKKTGKKKE